MIAVLTKINFFISTVSTVHFLHRGLSGLLSTHLCLFLQTEVQVKFAAYGFETLLTFLSFTSNWKLTLCAKFKFFLLCLTE